MRKQKDASTSFKNGKQPAEVLHIDDSLEDFQQPIKLSKRRRVTTPDGYNLGDDSEDDFVKHTAKRPTVGPSSFTSSRNLITSTFVSPTSRSITPNDHSMDDGSGDDFVDNIFKKSTVCKPSSSASSGSLIVSKSVSDPDDAATPENITKAGSASASRANSSKRILTIKTTVDNIWKKGYLRPLYNLVEEVNTLVTHTFGFSKYIFLKEMSASTDFNLADCVNKDFFVEVFLALIDRVSLDKNVKARTANFRQLISRHKTSYFQDADYVPRSFKYAQQVALYECTKISTAYRNNIIAQFGNKFRMFLNKLCKKNEKVDTLNQRMKEVGATEKALKAARQNEIFKHIANVKEALSRKQAPNTEFLDEKALS
ncbi:unnamed protein product [Mucor hiemalis]